MSAVLAQVMVTIKLNFSFSFTYVPQQFTYQKDFKTNI